MNRQAVIEILVKAFGALTKDELANFRYHLDNETSICCGHYSALFTDGNGGG